MLNPTPRTDRRGESVPSGHREVISLPGFLPQGLVAEEGEGEGGPRGTGKRMGCRGPALGRARVWSTDVRTRR